MNYKLRRELINLFLVAVGAFPGAVLRWLISNNFIVNIIGCFVLGLVSYGSKKKSYKLILGIGQRPL